MEHTHSLQLVPDDELLRRLTDLLRDSRRTEADLVALISEVDARGLYAREASPSIVAWCTEILHLSEAEAYLRIAAARASREHPVLLTMLADGRLHLTGLAKPTASLRRIRPAKGPRRTGSRPPRAMSRPRCGGPSTSEMAGAAGTRTRRVDDVRPATGSSSTTGIRSDGAAVTPWTMSPWFVVPTTATWPTLTMAVRPWRGIAG